MNAAIRERRPATEEISGLERNPVLETGDEAVWYAAVWTSCCLLMSGSVGNDRPQRRYSGPLASLRSGV